MVDVDPTPESPPEDVPASPEPPSAPDRPTPQEAFEQLRKLLLGDAAGQLDYVKGMRDPEQFAEHVARILPHAASIRASQDGRLAESLAPTVEDALETSIRRNPKPLTDAIFPILGPAIRKAISHAMHSLVQNVNQAIESTLTPRGIRLRMKAKRTGRSYAELVVAESLVYRVEEVFLIHGETGLLLAHVAVPDVVNPDTDLVSGMFTAIQDFVRDSFGVEDDAGLEQFRVGELTVLVEQGPLAVIAAVVRGTPGGSVRTKLQQVIEGIHAESRSALESFDGDAQRFEIVKPALQGCLTQQHRPPPEPTPVRKLLRRAIPALFGIGLLTLIGIWIASSIRQNALEGRVGAWVEALRDHPGARVLATTYEDARPHVAFVRDPIAADEVDRLRDQHLRADDDVTQAVVDMPLPHGPYILERARRILRPPTSVTLGLSGDNRVHASGLAAGSWIAAARLRGEQLSTGYDDRDVWPRRLASIRGPRDVLERQVLQFARGDDLFGTLIEKHLATVLEPLRSLDTALLELATEKPVTLDVFVRPVPIQGEVKDAREDERIQRLLTRLVHILQGKDFARLRFHPGSDADAATIPAAQDVNASKKIRHVILDVRVPTALLKDS